VLSSLKFTASPTSPELDAAIARYRNLIFSHGTSCYPTKYFFFHALLLPLSFMYFLPSFLPSTLSSTLYSSYSLLLLSFSIPFAFLFFADSLNSSSTVNDLGMVELYTLSVGIPQTLYMVFIMLWKPSVNLYTIVLNHGYQVRFFILSILKSLIVYCSGNLLCLGPQYTNYN
jgi:hypothetical protein